MQFAILTSVAALAFVGSASAAMSSLQFTVSSTSAGSGAWSSTGTATGTAGQYQFADEERYVGFNASFDLTCNDTSVLDRGLIAGSFGLTNNTASLQTFTIEIFLPTVAQGPSGLAGGSVGGLLTADGDGGIFSTAGTSAWNYFVRAAGSQADTTIASLINSPYSVTATPFGIAAIPGQSFGAPIPSMPTVGIGDAMGLRLVFQLGAGDRVEFGTSFVLQAVPAPGAGAMLGIAAILGKGRRRRA
jgi:hypothetical protein